MAAKSKKFKKSPAIEKNYARQLRGVAREVGRIVEGLATGTIESAQRVQQALNRYAEIITPWAQATAARTAAELNRQDKRTWSRNAQEMGVSMKKELADAPVGAELRRFLNDNVDLITSLPREAGQRVHDLTQQALIDSSRSSEIRDEILRTGEVTKGRATLIARTETARTASELTVKRAEHAGVTHFIWRTAGDADVRPSHRRLEGKTFAFANPPVVDGETLLPGQTFNCRCYPEPIIADEN